MTFKDEDDDDDDVWWLKGGDGGRGRLKNSLVITPSELLCSSG